jgi:FSR family fosmidomycin resistance protein-like MFS transporter
MTLASASSAIIVYALELVPGRIGMVAGLFFGLSFGMAGIGAAVLGRVADGTSIDTVYQLCAFLPAIGLLTALLPNLGRPLPPAAETSPQSTPMAAPARFFR